MDASPATLARPPSILSADYEYQVRKLLPHRAPRTGTKYEHRVERRGQAVGAVGAFAAADIGASASTASSASGIVEQLKQARALINAAKDGILRVRDRDMTVTNDDLERIYDSSWDVYDTGDQLTDLVDSFVE